MTLSTNQSSKTKSISLKKECKHMEVGEAKMSGDDMSGGTKLRTQDIRWLSKNMILKV